MGSDNAGLCPHRPFGQATAARGAPLSDIIRIIVPSHQQTLPLAPLPARAHPLPTQWLRVDFAGAKAVNEVSVYTVRDDYGAQTEPAAADTFTLYGASDYAVEYWTGAAWAGVGTCPCPLPA